jgi:peptide/nickel transport system substrate-binding protein
LAVGLPFSEFNRLTSNTPWTGNAYPVTDLGLIFLTNKDKLMKDRNIRLAMHHAIDKQKLIDELMLGYGRPMDSLQVPGYDAYDPSIGFGRPMDSFQVSLFDAYDPSIKTDFDPYRARNYLSKSGYSKSNPVKLTIQATRGYRPKDYEMVEMIAGMWQDVGIEAKIQIHTDTDHLRLRARHELAPAAFFNWSNSTGDPFMSTGLAMLSNSPDSAFKSAELDRMIMPLMNEPDERKRIRGYQKIDRYIAEEGLIIPLVQFFQTVAHNRDITFTPHSGGEVLPQEIRSL